MELNELRNEIDKIDSDILRSFETRMDICRKIAEFKRVNNVAVFQGNREAEIIERIRSASAPELADGASALFKVIMDISKSIQQQELLNGCVFAQGKPLDLSSAVKIGCQGIKGANSELAAKKLFGEDKEICFFHEFDNVFSAVEKGYIDFGVIPIQNSTAGSVTQTYDLLKRYNLYIAKTVCIEISHCLAVKKGTSAENIEKIYSHPQALYQCSRYIKENGFETVSYENTATAARLAAESTEAIGAICSEDCAQMYGLEIVKRDIANSLPNYTRFICVSKELLIDDSAKTISVMLTLPNTQGSLYRLLTKFFAAGLNLEKLESRPLAGGSFNVSFYLDFEGSIRDNRVSALLTELAAELEDFRFLGNFSEKL